MVVSMLKCPRLPSLLRHCFTNPRWTRSVVKRVMRCRGTRLRASLLSNCRTARAQHSHYALQLLGVCERFMDQLRGRKRQRLVAVSAERDVGPVDAPAAAGGEVIQLCFGSEHQHRLQIRDRDRFVCLLRALGDLVTHRVHQHIHKVQPLRSVRARLLRAQDAVVAALHDVLLQLRGELEELVARLQSRRQQLQLCVELRDPILGEKSQQVQAEQRVSPRRLWQQ
mmetsp:Transcript_33120/g.107108  ORF Transcript_33120/g.107108 Transcript_33120/m.107108 type:complete len:225 (-) Transcript_33120:308-982(-)|eukprot:scaffold25271_cov105-Isochrysis_galbana.AAC.4